MKKIIVIAFLFCFSNASFSQHKDLDSLSFNTEKGLLVFEGYLNGVRTDFAFDTGASTGVLNSKNVKEAKIVVSGDKIFRDSHKNRAKIGTAKVESIKIGHYNLSNIGSAVTDMPFLYCNKIYLLGGNVINQLNWKFNFKRNMVYFSKAQFLPSKEMVSANIRIVGNRHFADISMANINIKNILVDFGYNGNCTLNGNTDNTKQILSRQGSKVYKSQSFSMGLNSVSKGLLTSSMFVDSVNFGGHDFNSFKVNITENTDNKIGLFFMKNNFAEVIINTSELKYWLLPLNVAPPKALNFDAGFYYSDNGKIEVVSLNNEVGSSAITLKL